MTASSMVIGIDASRAFLKRRTGIEEYSYQVIRYLRDTLPKEHRVILYVRKRWRGGSGRGKWGTAGPRIDFDLPENWSVRGLWAPRLWTQVRLSLEMFLHPPDVLFVPAHTVPLLHPARTIVTVHGLEYEFCPRAYSFFGRLYMRLSIRFSVRVAETVIAVSENTKRDLVRLYGVPEKKIVVVYEGYDRQFQNPNFKIQNLRQDSDSKRPYLLFIGRLEERKNVSRLIGAFEILKRKHGIPHQLVLAGKPGHRYGAIGRKIQESQFKNEIQECGYVSEEEKWELLRGAGAFLFPSLYEGFGLPVLEAQSMGVPVVTSDNSSLREVGGGGAVYVDPYASDSIIKGVWKVLSDGGARDAILEAGRRNVVRFGWEKCATSVTEILLRRYKNNGS